MPRGCSVCASPNLKAVNLALARGQSGRSVAAEYGLGEDAVQRHSAAHLPKLVTDSQKAQEALAGFDVGRELVATYRQLSERLETAESDTAVAALANAKLKAIAMAREFGIDLPAEQMRYTVRLEMNPETGTDG